MTDHAVSVWSNGSNTIFVRAEGELLEFPANEPLRLIAFLRQRAINAQAPNKALRDLEREARAREWNAAWRAKAEEVRAANDLREERRKAREEQKKRGLLKRANQAQVRKEADEFFKELGL